MTRAALTRSAGRAALLAAVLVVVAVTAGRADLAALGTPFVLGPLLALRAGGRPAVSVGLRLTSDRSVEQGGVDALVDLVAGTDADAVAVGLPAHGGASAARPRLVALRAGRPCTLTLRVPTPRWGRHVVGPVRVLPHGAGLLTVGQVSGSRTATVSVLPDVQAFAAVDLALPTRMRFGSHRSRTLGQGVEPVAVRPYAAGDRIRQVDWRTTARTGVLHSRATSTDRPTDVVVLLDALVDPGPPGGTVLDTAVRAASAITEHYLGTGDAVGLVQLGGRLRTLRAGSGRGQLARAREWLLDVALPLNAAVARQDLLWAPPPGSTAALLVVLTPLLDARVPALLTTLRRHGSTVVAVDVLPPAALPPAGPRPDTVDELSRRLWQLERVALTDRLAELGIPVVAWTGAGSLDAVLAPLVRVASAPRPARQ